MSKSVRILEGYFQIEFYDHGKIYLIIWLKKKSVIEQYLTFF